MFLWTGSEPGPPAHSGNEDKLIGHHAEVPSDMRAGRRRGYPGRKLLYNTIDAHTHHEMKGNKDKANKHRDFQQVSSDKKKPILSSVQSLSHVQQFVTPWTAVCQASLLITNTQSLLKLMSIKSVMQSNHLILCCSLLLLPSIFSSIRVYSSESVLRIRWPKYWSFSFSISPSNIIQD